MFPSVYFPPAYFPSSYFPRGGTDDGEIGPPPVIPNPEVPGIWLTIEGGPIYVTTQARFVVTGRTSYDLSPVTGVTWSNHRGGSGTATGTNPWYVPLTLQRGANLLTFTATNDLSWTTTYQIIVIYTALPPTSVGGTTTLLPPG